MKIKDIVNRDIVTLTNCEHEPIHIPGSIQPHGFLIAVNAESWKIDFCSGNISDYLDINYTEVLGQAFSMVFGTEQQQVLQSYINKNVILPALPLEIILKENVIRLTIHRSGPEYILEAETTTIDTEILADVYKHTLQFVSYMNNTRTLQELCSLVAKGTREITGYDRVMVYRFDEQYNGEIFAESCRNDLEPFLGLHYPHTDIPVQARELYMKNLLRLIVDIDYIPVPIYTIYDIAGKNLDLSLATLRSTSPIHVEYLHNMGVGATLTISLIHKGKLWGLITCHHYSPKNLSPEIRMSAQLQGQLITSQIDVRESNEEYEVTRKTNIALENLNAFQLPPVYESLKEISKSPDLLKLCNADGVSILVSGKVYKNGNTPSNIDIRYFSEYFSVYSNDTTFHTAKLVDFVPELIEACKLVSGIQYHSLGNGNSIIWYRQERIAEVNWAGDPEKSIILDDKGLHPRNSFQLWKEIVKCRSAIWLQSERTASANYAYALQKQISMILLTMEEEKYRTLSEVLRETNSELENINWISTHDLQEPLRKIQMIASRALLNEQEIPSKSMIDSLHRMTSSANRMQTLLVDILKYTRIKHTIGAFEKIDLTLIVEETILDLEDIIRDKSVVINSDILPIIDGIPFLLKQLFSNIIQNSIKYSLAERTTVITITSSTVAERNEHIENGYCHWITIADNGIGFEQKYAESIFDIFIRLHGKELYNGSGVGLALCKKIMQTNNGNISATGILGEGAAITLYFPAEIIESHTVALLN